MFKLASLFVEIVAQTDSLDRALSRTHASLTTANVALGTFAGNVAASFARMAVGAAGGLFESTVRSASHLNETVNKTNVLFGASAKIITDHANTMADVYSEPKRQILDVTDNFALMGKEIGLSSDKAAEFGVKISRMALDARSLGDVETAARKIEAALAGQARPLRSLGIFINANTVKEEAARMGMKPGASGQFSEGQKIQARASLIENSEFMQKAAGDLARTFMETEGQTRALWGALSNLGTSIGQELNPAWNKLLIDINSGLGDLKGYFEANKSVIRGWADSVLEGFETAKVVWRNLPDVLEIALLGADQKMEDARAKIEIWATKTAVAVETAFLKASKKVGELFAGMGNIGNQFVSSHVGAVQALMPHVQSAASTANQAFDFTVGKVAGGSDVAFRPIRDLANAIERKAGAGDYKQMSVEEDIGRLKGALSGLPISVAKADEFLKIFRENLAIPVKPVTDDETALIAKANKHLAETLAQNTDISSKAIAAAQARIAKREAARLDAINTAAFEERLNEEAFIATSKADVFRPGRDIFGPDKEGGDEDAAVLGGMTKHQKGLEDTASFHASLMAEGLGGDVQQKQLTELQMIREIDQKNADMMEKMYNRSARAVYA
jgi:hypothetical protein